MKYSKMLLPFLLVSLISACQPNKQKESGKEVNLNDGYVAHLTQTDSANAQALVAQFMDYAKEGKLEQAAAMLCKPDTSNQWNEPMLLGNEELHEVASMLEAFPVKEYQVDYIHFATPLDNEAKCTIVMREAEGDLPAVTNSWYFRLVNYLGGWRLCLKDSRS